VEAVLLDGKQILTVHRLESTYGGLGQFGKIAKLSVWRGLHVACSWAGQGPVFEGVLLSTSVEGVVFFGVSSATSGFLRMLYLAFIVPVRLALAFEVGFGIFVLVTHSY
jgi:hypothetical protein